MQSLTSPGVLNPTGLSNTAATNLVNHVNVVPFISPRYRLLNRDLSPVDVGQVGLTNDSGRCDITKYVQNAPQIVMDTTQDSHYSTNLVLSQNASFDFNPLRHLIQIFLDYWTMSPRRGGTLLLEVPVMLGAVPNPGRDLADHGNVWQLSLLDLTSKIAKLKFLNGWNIAAAANVITAIQGILTQDYLPQSQGGSGVTPAGLDNCGPAWPIARLNLTPTSLTTPASTLFSPGDNEFAAVNGLLKSINYWPAWCDGMGTLQSAPIPMLYASVPPINWTYASDSTSTMGPVVQQRFPDWSQIRNGITVISQNSAALPFTATAFNDSANSGIGLHNWGEASTDVIQDDRIPDQATALARARAELQIDAGISDQIILPVKPNPFLQGHDSLSISITNPQGISEVQPGLYPFLISGWTLDLSNLSMTITASKQVAV